MTAVTADSTTSAVSSVPVVHECYFSTIASFVFWLLPSYRWNKFNLILKKYHYQRKLCGAIVQIHFTLVHYFIRQAKRSVFTTFTHKMIVLHSLLPTPVNPLKWGRLSDGPLLTCEGTSKKTRDVSLVPTISDISAYSHKLTFLCSFDRNPCPNACLFKEFVPNHPEKQSF